MLSGGRAPPSASLFSSGGKFSPSMGSDEDDAVQENPFYVYCLNLAYIPRGHPDRPEVEEACGLANKIATVVFWGCAVTGIPTNVLAFCVVMSFQRSTSTFYIALLSASDTVVLCTKVLLRSLVLADASYDNDLLKHTHHYMGVYSNWVLVLICLERVISIHLPLRKVTLLTMKRAKLSALGLFLVLLTLHISMMFTMDFLSVYWVLLFSVLHSFLPFILIVIGIVIIERSLYARRKARKSLMGRADIQELSMTELSITIMMLVTVLCFCLFTFPLCVHYMLVTFHWGIGTRSPAFEARLYLVDRLVVHSALFSHVANFFLYFISTKRFRERLCGYVKSYCSISMCKKKCARDELCERNPFHMF